jgi:hypothetical protein
MLELGRAPAAQLQAEADEPVASSRPKFKLRIKAHRAK